MDCYNITLNKKDEFTQTEPNLTGTKDDFGKEKNAYIFQKVSEIYLEYMKNTKDSKEKE